MAQDVITKLPEAIGVQDKVHNFSNERTGVGHLFELSSRTPWARAWVAVELYLHQGEVTGEKIHRIPGKKFDWDRIGDSVYLAETALGIGNHIVPDKYKTQPMVEQKEKMNTMEKKVYILGNHNYNQFSVEKNPHNPIQEGDKSLFETTKELGGKGITAESTFANQMQNNPFKKPPAGITSIDTKTEGFAGAIKHTTVNFVVHNFDDFQNVYSKFFLKPGATVIVDFGWDTSTTYDPQTVSGDDIRKGIYGSGGVLEKAAGDLEVVIGKVNNFTAAPDENGSFVCSMTIISDNAGVLDYEISEKNKLKSRLTDNLSTILINKVATRIGASFLRRDWTSESAITEESNIYANSFANKLFSNGKESTIIPEDAVKAGIYWQSLGTEKINVAAGSALGGTNPYFKINLFGEWWDSDPNTENLIEGVKADSAVTDNNNLYVSWAFFEEEILNNELGFSKKDPEFFGGSFDSTDSFVTYEENLVHRQRVSHVYSRKKTGYKFLYPPSWNETYHTIHYKDKIISRPEESVDFKDISNRIHTGDIDILAASTSGNSITSLDQNTNRIPLREIFINVNLIKEAFSNNSNVSEAVIEILNTLNEDSMNVFNLKLIAGTRDNSTMAVIDSNHYNSEYNLVKGDKFQNLFTFHPYSKGSIVKEMSLNYTTPNNALQTMIAIQNKSANVPIFPITEMEDTNQALRTIYQILDSENKTLGIRHLPAPDISNKNNQPQKKETTRDTSKRKTLLENNVDNVIDQYQELMSRAKKFEKEEGEKFHKDMYDDTDNIKASDFKASNYKSEDNDPEELLYPNAFYAKDIEEYFEYKCRTDFVHKRTSPLIPIELSLTTYGVSGILPGDIFDIDYLPSQYKNRTYFQVMNVSHNIGTDGWKTTFETQMRVRQDKLEKGTFKHPTIYLSADWISKTGISPLVREMFKDFVLDDRTESGVLVFEARGKKSGTFSPRKSFETAYKNSWIGPGYFNGTTKQMHNEGYEYPKEYFGSIDVEFQTQFDDHKYLIVAVAGGAYAFNMLNVIRGELSLEKRIDLIKKALINFVTQRSNLSNAMTGDSDTPLWEQ